MGKLKLLSLLLIGLFIMSSCVVSVSAKDKNDEIKVKQNTFFELDIPSIPDKMKNELELAPTFDKEYLDIYTNSKGLLCLKALKKRKTILMLQLIDKSNNEILRTKSFNIT